MNLLDKYRPRDLADLRGQSWIAIQLKMFVADPHPAAFLFEGESGTGKTTAALLLAEALGVCVAEQEMGGLHQIASGEQTGETVRRRMDGLHTRPFCGSGWKVLIVNEADAMTPNAAYVWFDALEPSNLPPKTVVIFTTNHARKLPGRFRDRCERMTFESSAMLLRPDLQELANHVWATEVGGQAPDVETFGPLGDDNGNASFRRLLQQMTPYLRAKSLPTRQPEVRQPSSTPKPKTDRSAAARKAWVTRNARKKKELVTR
jgi:hypothetical protein